MVKTKAGVKVVARGAWRQTRGLCSEKRVTQREWPGFAGDKPYSSSVPGLSDDKSMKGRRAQPGFHRDTKKKKTRVRDRWNKEEGRAFALVSSMLEKTNVRLDWRGVLRKDGKGIRKRSWKKTNTHRPEKGEKGVFNGKIRVVLQ